MRLYGKKFLRNKMSEVSLNNIETRDAVLWDVIEAQRICRVKIQGSDELVVANYPENWEQTPFWLKPGNAVRIIHMGGVRGRIELAGMGQFVPTPVVGGATPPSATPPNAVLTGGHVGASTPFAMSVDVEAASYRIGGIPYTSAATTLPIDAHDDGLYRYDVIYGDTAGTIHVKKGTPATSNPIIPSLDDPSTQIQLGYVLVYTGMTEITPVWTNREWSIEKPASVTVTPTPADIPWVGDPSSTVRVEVFDQYGNPVTTTAPGWHMTLEFQNVGNGTITPASGDTGGNSYYDFTYTRDVDPGDVSPTLKGTCVADHNVSGYTNIILRDIDGNPMGGGVYEGKSANLAFFPEYAGATMTPSGSNNDPGTFGMTSDFETISDVLYNYYEWKSDIATPLQSYDINVKIPIPFNFSGLQVGVSVVLTVDIKTEENTTTNNKIDITLQRDGNVATSALTNQKSASAGTWVAVGFDETDTVLAAVVAGDILNVTIRMYSMASKYARVGKINLQTKLA